MEEESVEGLLGGCVVAGEGEGGSLGSSLCFAASRLVPEIRAAHAAQPVFCVVVADRSDRSGRGLVCVLGWVSINQSERGWWCGYRASGS